MPATLARAAERFPRMFVGAVELRAAKEGSSSPGTIFGYAAKFGTTSVDLGGFYETIAPGAFRGCIGDDVRCLYNHETLIGRSTAGTLTFGEDGVGLWFECELPNTTTGRDVYENIRLKNITGCSFMFTMPSDGGDAWDWSAAIPLRTIKRVSRLYDVGPVDWPAYEDTSVDMRADDAAHARSTFEHAKEARDAAIQLEIRDDLDRLKARHAHAADLLIA